VDEEVVRFTEAEVDALIMRLEEAEHILRIIWEADMLREHAYESDEADLSIATRVQRLLWKRR
jgi:hypothetical protein